jgi:hypothetical protein
MTMQAILDFARDHIETIICAVAGVCFWLAWTINQGALRISGDIDAKLREFRAEVDREMSYSAEVARLLETGIELMTPAQVEQWAGVREFLDAYGAGSAKGEDDDAETDEPAREGHPSAKERILFQPHSGRIVSRGKAEAAAIRAECNDLTGEERTALQSESEELFRQGLGDPGQGYLLEALIMGDAKIPRVAFESTPHGSDGEFYKTWMGAKDADGDIRQPFTLRNADADLTHPGYPPEYSLTSAEIADRLRVGIMDFEEPGDADAGFPDWTPKAQRPF